MKNNDAKHYKRVLLYKNALALSVSTLLICSCVSGKPATEHTSGSFGSNPDAPSLSHSDASTYYSDTGLTASDTSLSSNETAESGSEFVWYDAYFDIINKSYLNTTHGTNYILFNMNDDSIPELYIMGTNLNDLKETITIYTVIDDHIITLPNNEYITHIGFINKCNYLWVESIGGTQAAYEISGSSFNATDIRIPEDNTSLLYDRELWVNYVDSIEIKHSYVAKKINSYSNYTWKKQIIDYILNNIIDYSGLYLTDINNDGIPEIGVDDLYLSSTEWIVYNNGELTSFKNSLSKTQWYVNKETVSENDFKKLYQEKTGIAWSDNIPENIVKYTDTVELIIKLRE